MNLQDFEETLFLAKISEEAFDFSNKKIEMFEKQNGKISQQMREGFLVAGAIQYFYTLLNESGKEEPDDPCDDCCCDEDDCDNCEYNDDVDYDEKFSSNRDALEALLKALTK